jgi:hypothetical protein
VLALLAVVALGACADERRLRDQQAELFKQRCLSFAIRAGANREMFEGLQKIPTEKFRVGGGVVHGGDDSLEPCRTHPR